MAISQINTVLVKHSKVLFGLFTFIIIIAFVCFFTPGLDIGIFAGGARGGRNAVMATVFGEKVTVGQAIDDMRDLEIAAAAYYGLRPGAVNISREPDFRMAAAGVVAQKVGILITREEIGACIRKFPTFQEKGQFNFAKYQKYEKDVLVPSGCNTLTLEKAVGKLMVMQAVFGFTPFDSNIFAIPRLSEFETFETPLEFSDFQRMMLEKFTFQILAFEFETFKKDICPENRQLAEFHKANQAKFQTVPKYQADVISFKIPATPAGAAQAYYNSNKKEFTKDGKIQPFHAVSKEINNKLKEIALRQTMELAGAFRDKLSTAASAGGIVGDRTAYVALFRKMATERRISIVQTGWLDRNTKELKGIGKEPKLVAAIDELAHSKRSPVTRSIAGDQAVYIAAITEEKPARNATLAESIMDVRAAYLDVQSKKAAQEAAANFLKEAKKSANPAADLNKLAAGKAKITKAPQINRMMGDTTVVDSLKPNTFSAPMADLNAIYIVFLEQRTQPTAKECADNRKMLENIFKQYIKGTVRMSFNEWISSNIMVDPRYAGQQQGAE